MGPHDFLGHEVFRIEQFEHCSLLLGGPFANRRPVAGAQVVEGPDEAEIDVEAAIPLDGLAAGTALKCRAVKDPTGAVATL